MTPSGVRTGKLVVDVNNRRLNFAKKRPDLTETNRFYFLDDGEPYAWYNEGEPITLADALTALPPIRYEKDNNGRSSHTT